MGMGSFTEHDTGSSSPTPAPVVEPVEPACQEFCSSNSVWRLSTCMRVASRNMCEMPNSGCYWFECSEGASSTVMMALGTSELAVNFFALVGLVAMFYFIGTSISNRFKYERIDDICEQEC